MLAMLSKEPARKHEIKKGNDLLDQLQTLS